MADCRIAGGYLSAEKRIDNRDKKSKRKSSKQRKEYGFIVRYHDDCMS